MNLFDINLPSSSNCDKQSSVRQMRAIVVIPTYNECNNLQTLLKRIESAVPGLHVLIVDDNSPDGTGQLAEHLSEHSSGCIFVVRRPRKDGLGRAYVDGFRFALARGYQIVIQMDADLSHDPSYLPALLKRMDNCDLVLGSRYVSGVSVVGWDLKRLVLSKGASRYVRMITRMPFSDPTGGFKCWRRQALLAIDLERCFSNGYLFQVETTYRAWQNRARIEEAPIVFYERSAGVSKMHWRIIWEAIWGVIRLRLSARRAAPLQSATPHRVLPETKGTAA